MALEPLKTFSGRPASQNAYELGGFIDLLRQRKVSSYLEIGSRDGDTFHEIMRSLPRGSRGVAVDMPGGLWGKGKTQKRLARALADLQRRGYQVSSVIGDSKALSTRTLVRMRGPYDAALIDGDHTYEGVSADWANYGDISPIVAFHDIVGTGQREKSQGLEVEVPKLWAEIKNSRGFDAHEFIYEGSKMGIGVLVKC